MATGGQNANRKLPGGEIVALVKPPGEQWRISYYEYHQRVRFDVAVGGNVLEWRTKVPDDWKDRRFDSAEEAFAFVEQEISAGRAPSNSMGGA
jgi:hypothetical protein